MANMNMDDPSVQEAIRRKPHEYVPGEGKHGVYREKPYVHQEYPKMLGKWPKPEYATFTKENGVSVHGDVALQRFQAALIEWDRAMTDSIVNNKAEERAWQQDHA